MLKVAKLLSCTALEEEEKVTGRPGMKRIKAGPSHRRGDEEERRPGAHLQREAGEEKEVLM